MGLKLVNTIQSNTGIVILQFVPEKESQINSSLKNQVYETIS